MKKLSSGCTLDCFDCCRFDVYVENNEVVKIEGDKSHPYTKGFICNKGRAHLNRQNHPDRQYMPLLKVDGAWKTISFEQALDLMAQKLTSLRETDRNQSVLYYEQYGNGSVLKSIGDVFFNFYGGCAKQKGGPCWSAGIAAQKLNFGNVKSHSLEDMLQSQTILVWGKNPAATTIHTMQMMNKAKRNGSYVIVIDPVETATAKQADSYVQIKPGGDSALALAMAKRIMESGRYDKEYVKEYVNGFEAFRDYVESLSYEELCKRAGITKETVDFLVEKYTEKYSTILIGYGLQKYYNGGNTIHLIDALAAITGQIGEIGGGVNYANRVFPDVLDSDPYGSERFADNVEFDTAHISSFIEKEKIQAAVIVKSNLFAQLPGLKDLEKSFSQIPFKVCFDQFLTDTAKQCDLFIPTTTVLESEDLLYSSMTNPYLTYIEKAVEPREALMDEYAFFMELAVRMKLESYPKVQKREYLNKVLEPLKKYEKDMSLEYLKEHYFTIHQNIPWADKKFDTDSGKFELLFQKEDYSLQKKKRGLRLLTTHSKDTLFSQHFMDKTGASIAYLNEKMAQERAFTDGEMAWLSTAKGKIQVQLQIDNAVCDDVVRMDVGWWKKHGNPNWILDSGISDIGGQVTYHENEVILHKL